MNITDINNSIKALTRVINLMEDAKAKSSLDLGIYDEEIKSYKRTIKNLKKQYGR